MKDKDEAIKQYLARIGSKGGKVRASRYDEATLREWGRKGGRPRKRGKQDGVKAKN